MTETLCPVCEESLDVDRSDVLPVDLADCPEGCGRFLLRTRPVSGGRP